VGVGVEKIYLDSCIAIYLVEEHVTFAKPVLEAIATVLDAQFCVSPLVELECLVGPFKLADQGLQSEYEQFFAGLSRLGIPDDAYRTAARLRSAHNLRTPDALHIAVARYHSCTQFWTNDDRLAKAAPHLAINIVAPLKA
jgi:uncharacterized protein